MRKLVVGGIVAAALIVASGIATYGMLFRAKAMTPEWIVATYTGDVSVRVGGGEWQPADIKMRLANRDRVRTAADSEITLVHGASHVTVRSTTEVQVADLRDDASKFSITSGSLYVEARGDRVLVRTLTGAAVDATDAGLGMTVKPDGYTLVQVKRGEADFSSMGRTERVTEGMQRDARAGRPPSRAVAIPEGILLNVQFPDAETFNSRLLRIAGQADPGSDVKVGGRTVTTDDLGRFAVDIELDEGVSRVQVSATDALGRTRVEMSDPLNVDVTAPILSGASIGARAVTADAGKERNTP